MDKEYFLFQDRIQQIESSFIKDGWLTIYESDEGDVYDQCLIFCCIVYSSFMEAYKKDSNWIIQPGSEGKPTIMGTSVNGEWQDEYQTFGDEGIEPFIFSRWFSHNKERYIDVSEEFVFYFKLYEKGESKQNRTYFFVDDLGELEEVIRIVPGKVILKVRYLLEYISVRKVHFAVCFDFMRFAPLAQDGFKALDQDYKTEKHNYNHYMRVLAMHIDDLPLQSWIHGKSFIYFDNAKSGSYHFGWENKPYEKFITGYDQKGDEVLEDCKKEDNKLFKLTYFKKEVLNKYYNEPTIYEVDGWHIKSPFFYLKIDNHNSEYVAVFLVELGSIPYKEQLHWKQYNIPPQGGMSSIYYKTMIEGSWAEHSGTPDLFFKEKYTSFNKKWKDKFGWYFYKPLSKEDKHHFISLHIAASNNIKEFCEQILSLVKITIDSLNEKELAKVITVVPGDKGISKLEKYLDQQRYPFQDMIEFLRNLQDMRSGLIAHRFSNSNKKAKQAIEYFKITDTNLVAVAKDIFIKSIITMNTLENVFIQEV